VFYKEALASSAGSVLGGILVVCMVAGIVLTMSTRRWTAPVRCTAIAKDGMTIKWFALSQQTQRAGARHGNRPLMNIVLVLVFGTAIEILAAGNLG